MAEIMPYKSPQAPTLPDNKEWEKRFEIRSETSSRIYVIARNKKSQKWGCSCPGYRIHRRCKHLVEGCRLSINMIHGRDHLENQGNNYAKKEVR